MGIIKGKKLMLFVKKSNSYVSVGYATNHTLSTSASTIDVAHKDTADAGGGKWDDQDLDTLSWTITTENFYANDAEGIGYTDLFGYYASGTVLDVKFGIAADSTTGVPTGGWVAPVSGALVGKAIITSIDVNAPVGDNASFSMTLTGKGPLAIES